MYRLGIDLGGTNIVAGLVDEEYKIVAKASCKTNVPRPESSICDSMAEVALKACEKAGVSIDEVESIAAVSDEMYAIIVLMCIATTIIAPPILSILYRKKYKTDYVVSDEDKL